MSCITGNNLIQVNGVSPILPVNVINFKQFSVQEDLEIPKQKPDIESIICVSVQANITSTTLIRTPQATSNEGQILTGFKLVVQGVLRQQVEYVADEPTQTVHSAHFDMPFCTFIVLPADFQDGSSIDVQAYIEDIYVTQIDKRHLFKNVTVLINANVESPIA
jgi:hypothetical protein